MPDLSEKNVGDIRHIRPQNIINEFLKDPNGSIDLNVDGSSTPVEFGYTVPDYPNAPSWIISGLAFIMNDNGIVLATKFGAINGGLANGLQLKLFEPGLQVSLNLFNIKFNLDFALITNAGTIGLDLNTEGGTTDSLTALVSSPGSGYRFLCNPGTRVSLVVRDDLSSLGRLNVVAHGFIRVE